MEPQRPTSEGGFLISYPLWVPGVAPGDDGPESEVPVVEIPDLGTVVCIFMSKPEAERYMAANLTECPIDRLTEFQTADDCLDWMRGLPKSVGHLAFPTLDAQGLLDSASFVCIADYVNDLETGNVRRWTD